MLAVLIEPEEEESVLLKNVTDLAVMYLGRYYTYMIQTAGWKAGKNSRNSCTLENFNHKEGAFESSSSR